jgi:hypothetical protein
VGRSELTYVLIDIHDPIEPGLFHSVLSGLRVVFNTDPASSGSNDTDGNESGLVNEDSASSSSNDENGFEGWMEE